MNFSYLHNTIHVTRVFQVYDLDLISQNVYFQAENYTYPINYYVINYSRNNVNYQVINNQLINITTETPGLIKLTDNNFNGTLKVAYANYDATTINGLIDTYPLNYKVDITSSEYFINSNFNNYYRGYDLFTLAYEIESNTAYQIAANSLNYTYLQLSTINNTSYLYKKENFDNPLRYPGVRVEYDNSLTIPSTVTITRSSDSGLVNFCKIVMSSVDIKRKLVFENVTAQINFTNNSTINLEIFSNNLVNLTLTLFGANSTNYYNVFQIHGNNLQQLSFNINQFFSFNSIWNSLNNSVNLYSTNLATITQNQILTTITTTNINNLNCFVTSINFQIIRVIAGSAITNLNQVLNIGVATATLVLDNQTTTNLPLIIYRSTGLITLTIVDSNSVLWNTDLPTTNGIFTEYQLTTNVFPRFNASIFSVSFSAESNCTLDLFSVGSEISLLTSGIIYGASITDNNNFIHNLYIGTFKANINSNESVNYPGVVPFSNQSFISSNSILENSFQDCVYSVNYQSPYHANIFDSTGIIKNNQLQYLYDSLLNYNKQINGLMTPGYVIPYWNTDNFTKYCSYNTYQQSETVKLEPIYTKSGSAIASLNQIKYTKVFKKIGGIITSLNQIDTPKLYKIAGSAIGSLNQKTATKTVIINKKIYNFNQFTWLNYDPRNTEFLYYARTIESVARYLMIDKTNQNANIIVASFLNTINNLYVSTSSIQPPTDITTTGLNINYHNPGCAAIIGRIALWANLAGLDSTLTLELITNSFDYIESQFVNTGNMNGSWSNNQNNVTISGNSYKEYFNNYHSECILFLSELFANRNLLKYPYSENSNTFPNLVPDFIDNFSLSDYKNSTLKFTDNEQTLLYSNLSVGATLSLKYNLITSDKFDTLIQFWKSVSTVSCFQLPNTIWKHPSNITNYYSSYYWYFSERPQFNVRVSNSTNFIYNVEIKLTQALFNTQANNLLTSSTSGLNLDPDPIIVVPGQNQCINYNVTYQAVFNDGTIGNPAVANVYGKIIRTYVKNDIPDVGHYDSYGYMVCGGSPGGYPCDTTNNTHVLIVVDLTSKLQSIKILNISRFDGQIDT